MSRHLKTAEDRITAMGIIALSERPALRMDYLEPGELPQPMFVEIESWSIEITYMTGVRIGKRGDKIDIGVRGQAKQRTSDFMSDF